MLDSHKVLRPRHRVVRSESKPHKQAQTEVSLDTLCLVARVIRAKTVVSTLRATQQGFQSTNSHKLSQLIKPGSGLYAVQQPPNNNVRLQSMHLEMHGVSTS